MKTAIVGYTGFVGSNIYSKGKFDNAYNSKNIESAYGTNPDLLIYSGLRAEKYLANSNPKKDLELIMQAEYNIQEIHPKKLVLISTIDVFKNPIEVDENSMIETDGLHPYGYNRYQLELWTRKMFPDALIIRLPALFGNNIKKNFIYDYMNVIPYMLKPEKYREILCEDSEIEKYYEYQENGFYKVNVSDNNKKLLKEKFKKIGFSAINFTDSRSAFQFYNLDRLWNDIQIALNSNINIWHPATEPVSAGEVYSFLTGKEFVNELEGIPSNYDYKTLHADLFGGSGNYICDKAKVMEEIKGFVNR